MEVGNMEYALLIVCILLIAIVLLQSHNASDASQIISGGVNAELFQNQKERGVELLITRLTVLLGVAFFVLSFIIFIIG